MTPPETGGQARSVGGVGVALLVILLAIGAWFVLGDRAPGVERASQERTQPDPPERGPELAGGAPRPTPPVAPAREEPASARTARWRIEGRVLGADSRGTPGAEVLALLWSRSLLVVVGRAISGPDGAFTIDLAAVRAVSPFSRADVGLLLRASADRHGVGEQHVRVEWPADDAPELRLRQDVLLSAGDVLRGRVVRTDGTPVSRARVGCCDGSLTAGSTETLPDGRFTLSRPPEAASGRWFVVAAHAAHGSGRVGIPPHPDERDLPEVLLQATPIVEGRVVYGDGSPVAGAAVGGRAEASLDACAPTVWPQPLAYTHADGSFRILMPVGGPCRLFVDDEERGVLCSTGDRDVRIVVGRHRVRLRAVDAEGRPLPGLGLLVTSWRAQHADQLDGLLAGRVDHDTAVQAGDADLDAGDLLREDGSADFWAEPGSAWAFTAHVPGAAPSEAWIRVPAEGNESESRLVVAPAAAGGRVSVRVTDPDGKDVPSAQVEVSTMLGTSLHQGHLARETVLGPFPAGRLRVSARPTTGAADRGWLPAPDVWLLEARETVVVQPGDTAAVTLRPARGGRVRLTLRGPAPAGLQGKRLSVLAIPEDGSLPTSLMAPASSDEPDVYSTGFEVVPERWTAAATLLGPGGHRFEVGAVLDGQRRAIGAGQGTVRPGEVVDVTLELTPR